MISNKRKSNNSISFIYNRWAEKRLQEYEESMHKFNISNNKQGAPLRSNGIQMS